MADVVPSTVRQHVRQLHLLGEYLHVKKNKELDGLLSEILIIKESCNLIKRELCSL